MVYEKISRGNSFKNKVLLNFYYVQIILWYVTHKIVLFIEKTSRMLHHKIRESSRRDIVEVIMSAAIVIEVQSLSIVSCSDRV